MEMTSNCSYVKTETFQERARYWEDATVPKQDSIELSSAAIEKSRECTETEFPISEEDKRKIQLLEEFISRLTGKKFKFKLIDKIKINDDSNKFFKDLDSLQTRGQGSTARRQGWGFTYSFNSSTYESEKVSFSTKGIVRTEDGRTIDFSVDLNMSREFMSSTSINVKAGDALIDPLVLNYNNNIPRLSEEKISFDINMDGGLEEISFPTEGCGFLALDTNNDGVINNGKELFGPTTGSGFNELKSYDSDGNNWIDENDSIFNKLQIWSKDENGNDTLLALGQVGVGAIYLGNLSTDFSLNTSQNESLGKIQSTGVFLKEDGTPGVIQHIDISV